MDYVDVHIHILPGVDDGSRNSEMTKEMLHIAHEEGIGSLIATPHYKTGRCGLSAKEVQRLVNKWNTWCQDNDLDITLYPGTEVYYHNELEGKIDSGWLQTLNNSQYLLVEFGPFEEFSFIRNALDDIFSLGLKPVLAHVERYECMLKDVERVRDLHSMGVIIQSNAGSVIGSYGGKCKRFVKKCLKEDLIHLIGTDAHNTEGRAPQMRECAKYLEKKFGRKRAADLMANNARQLFNID